ncbi:uncharacterized protein LOC134577473 [Pelobates fuscus]|uniref:uncharacterized protein LOC134577473 n=1 Tax=Pelobates fuscus TaxID=191477 RepID=UPI002FE443AC
MDPALQSEILIVVLHKPGGVSTEEFAGLFHQIHGYQFKLSNYGYNSLKLLLEDMRNLVELKTTPNGSLIKCISPNEHKVIFISGNNHQTVSESPKSSLPGPGTTPVLKLTYKSQDVILSTSKTELDMFNDALPASVKGQSHKGASQELSKGKLPSKSSAKQQHPSANCKTAQSKKVEHSVVIKKNTPAKGHDESNPSQSSPGSLFRASITADGINCSNDENTVQQKYEKSNLLPNMVTKLQSSKTEQVEKADPELSVKQKTSSIKSQQNTEKGDLSHMPNIMKAIQKILYEYMSGLKLTTLEKLFKDKYKMDLEECSKVLGHKEIPQLLRQIPSIKVTSGSNGNINCILKKYMNSKTQNPPVQNMNSAIETRIRKENPNSRIQVKDFQNPAVNRSAVSNAPATITNVTSDKAMNHPTQPTPMGSTINGKKQKTPTNIAHSIPRQQNAPKKDFQQIVKKTQKVASAETIKQLLLSLPVDHRVNGETQRTQKSTENSFPSLQNSPKNSSQQIIGPESHITKHNNYSGVKPPFTYAQICKKSTKANCVPICITQSESKPCAPKREALVELSNTKIKENIAHVLKDYADGISIFHFQKKYIFKFKQPLSLNGFSSAKQFLMAMKDVVSVQGLGVQALLFPVISNAMASNEINNTHGSTHLIHKSNLFTSKENVIFQSASPSLNANTKSKTFMNSNKTMITNQNITEVVNKPDEKEWPALSSGHLTLRLMTYCSTPYQNSDMGSTRTESSLVPSLQKEGDALLNKEAKDHLSISHLKTSDSHANETDWPTLSDSLKKLKQLPDSQTIKIFTETPSSSSSPQNIPCNDAAGEMVLQQTQPQLLLLHHKDDEIIPNVISEQAEDLSEKKMEIVNSRQENYDSKHVPTETKLTKQTEPKEREFKLQKASGQSEYVSSQLQQEIFCCIPQTPVSQNEESSTMLQNNAYDSIPQNTPGPEVSLKLQQQKVQNSMLKKTSDMQNNLLKPPVISGQTEHQPVQAKHGDVLTPNPQNTSGQYEAPPSHSQKKVNIYFPQTSLVQKEQTSSHLQHDETNDNLLNAFGPVESRTLESQKTVDDCSSMQIPGSAVTLTPETTESLNLQAQINVHDLTLHLSQKTRDSVHQGWTQVTESTEKLQNVHNSNVKNPSGNEYLLSHSQHRLPVFNHQKYSGQTGHQSGHNVHNCNLRSVQTEFQSSMANQKMHERVTPVTVEQADQQSQILQPKVHESNDTIEPENTETSLSCLHKKVHKSHTYNSLGQTEFLSSELRRKGNEPGSSHLQLNQNMFDSHSHSHQENNGFPLLPLQKPLFDSNSASSTAGEEQQSWQTNKHSCCIL